ncbi:Permease, MFS superfamily (plasmid) [Gordonia sp. KTR9]|nr:Permease, MFS superfamily [Gordonia sp. KTR9]
MQKRRCRWAPLWVASAAQLMLVLDVSVVNVALPHIQSDLAIPDGSVQWVASAYALVFAGGLLVGGRLADVFGLRSVFVTGLTVFVLASVVGGLASSAVALIGARALQGVGAAVASPATFTVLTRSYPEGSQRTRAVAVWTAVSLVGGGLGNVVGGFLTDAVSWRAVLLINLPIGCTVIVAALLVLPRREFGRRGRIDVVGATLATVALVGITVAVSEATSAPHMAAAATVVTVIAGAGCVMQQRHSRTPLVPARLLRNRVVMAGNGLMLLTGICFQAPVWLFLTYLMQRDMGFTPLQAGIGFVPLTVVTMLVGTLVAPRILKRSAPGSVIAAGAAVAAVGFAWQALAPTDSFSTAVLGPAVVIGIGGGLLNTPLGVAVTNGVADADAGGASGVMNTAKQLGGALGLAALTPLTADYTTFTTAFEIMAALMAAVAVTARWTIRPQNCIEPDHIHER